MINTSVLIAIAGLIIGNLLQMKYRINHLIQHCLKLSLVLFLSMELTALICSADPNNAPPEIFYRAPATQEKVRVNSVIRNHDDALRPNLFILSPDHIAYTTKTQPTIYWYQSHETTNKIEVSILNADTGTSLLDSPFELGKSRAGIHKFKLSDLNVKLKKKVKYKFTVNIVADSAPDNRSKDIYAHSLLSRIDTPAEVIAGMGAKSKVDLAKDLAENGIWYDAIEIISDLIELRPNDVSLIKIRAELFEQGDLREVALFERNK